MAKKQYIKYGGASFTNNVPPEDINNFVRMLPGDKRDNLFEVIKELNSHGLITVDDSDLTTVDRNMLPYMDSGIEHYDQ